MATGTLIFLIVVCLWNYISGERSRIVYQTKDLDLNLDKMTSHKFLNWLFVFTSCAMVTWLFAPRVRRAGGIGIWITQNFFVLVLLVLVGITYFWINILWIFGAFAMGFGRHYAWKGLAWVSRKLGAGAGFIWDKLTFWKKGYRGVRRRTLSALKKLERVLEGSLCQQSLLEARRLYDNVLPSLQRQIEGIDMILAMEVLKTIPENSEYYRRAAMAEQQLRALRADVRRQSREIPELVASWVPAGGLAVAREQTASTEALIREETERMEENLRAIEEQVSEVEDEHVLPVEV